MEENLIDLFCLVDDFCKLFLADWDKHLINNRLKKRVRASQLSPREIMMISVHFQKSHYRDFKSYYIHHVHSHLSHLFPELD